MFTFKKPEPAIYRSEATGAEFKFRQSNQKEKEKLTAMIDSEADMLNKKSQRVSFIVEAEDYYAAWLLEDFSGVNDENGKSHVFTNFDLADKAGLMQTLKQTDSEFAPWFEAHCEPVEKKIKEAATPEHVVGAAALPNVQG
jgi:uncharacterized protein YdcH (DUF465 family)